MKKGDTYFMAGNTYQGCGHKHRTAKAAKPCVGSMRLYASMTGGHRDAIKIHRVQFAVKSHSCAKMECPR